MHQRRRPKVVNGALGCVAITAMAVQINGAADPFPGRGGHGAGHAAHSQAPAPGPQPAPALSQNQQQIPNGISVGRPKVFDNRTLTLMLENLSETLRTLQVIDQKTVTAALGLLQGFRSREFSSSLTVGTVPTPATTEETTTSTGLVNAQGTALPDTSTQKATTTLGSVSPQIPALEAAAPLAGFNPQFGGSASDLLSDQVNLSYQIFNLRMILERSLSDRLLASVDDANDNRTRLQAVLGFNVTIDPPRTAEEAVAVVEVTLEPHDHQPVLPPFVPSRSFSAGSVDDRLSLVALMPQEKTYNSAALSTKSNSFGGAAVAGMVHVGYNQRRRGQTFYVYRDADTIAYDRMGTGRERGLKFGWMFRPVLGQKAVTPGARQLFAVVSLPRKDTTAVDLSQVMKATVRTYWKKYDADTRTSFERPDANRAARVRYGASLGLATPEIFADRYVNQAEYSGIEVRPTALYQSGLMPLVTNIRWETVGPKTVVLSVEGNNFFTGTQVALGGKTYVGGGDGLLLKSNQALDLTVPLEVLETGTGAIIGRYGSAVPLRFDPAGLPGLGGTAPAVLRWEIGPELSGTRIIELCLNRLPRSSANALTRVEPILSVNSTVIPPPYLLTSGCIAADEQSVKLTATVGAEVLKEIKGVIKLTWPFIHGWTWINRLYDPNAAIGITRLDDTSILLTHEGPQGFWFPPELKLKEPCWMLVAQSSFRLRTRQCPQGSDKTRELSSSAIVIEIGKDAPERMVLINPKNNVFVLDTSKKAEAAQPKVPEVTQFDAVWIDVPVKQAASVVTVDANQIKLPFRRPPGAKPGDAVTTLHVQITRDVTARPGTVDLTFLDKDGTAVEKARVKVVCRQCGNDNGER